MLWPEAAHRLEADALVALGSGEFSAQTISRLRAAELSKHYLMLEALRRRTGARLVQTAFDILSEVQEHAPEVVDEVIGSPHLGFWAANCLSRLPPPSGRSRSSPHLQAGDLAPLAAFTAVAALRTGYPIDLPVPIRRGVVDLPMLGTARVASPRYSGWARVRIDRRGATITSAFRTVGLTLAAGQVSGFADPAWEPAKWLTASTAGIRLKVTLGKADPFLTQLGPQWNADAHPSSAVWQDRIEAAWRLLAVHHRSIAEQLAASVTTLIPLQAPSVGDVVAATSGWAWGAIWLNLPADDNRLAETLVHEFHHLVLAAAEELAPLVHAETNSLYYVSWRDDPRPPSAALQGTYAQLGVAGFWRRQREVEPSSTKFRAEVEFVRARSAALWGGQSLIESDALTKAGLALVKPMLRRLEEWRHEPVWKDAESAAAEIAAEHRLRWRLSHLRPPTGNIEAAARAWLLGEPRMSAILRDCDTLHPFTRRINADLARLLEVSYRNPMILSRTLAAMDKNSSEVAFMSGHYGTAKEGYVQRIKVGDDHGAWIGILLTLRRISGSLEPVVWQAEILAALYDRIIEITGKPADPEELIAWLSDSRNDLGMHRTDIEVHAATLCGAT